MNATVAPATATAPATAPAPAPAPSPADLFQASPNLPPLDLSHCDSPQPDLPSLDLPQLNLSSILTNRDLVDLFKTYQILPHLLRELATDRAIAPFTCTPAEAAAIREQFFAQQQIPPEQQAQWLQAKGLTLEEVMAPLKRGIRIEKFKQATWGHRVESYFLQRKAQLDQVIYSMIQHTNSGLITELHFRLQDGESAFAELASQYSQGLAGKTKGIMGPVELGDLHPNLSSLFQQSQPQELVKTCIGDWFILAQVEVKIPAQLDAAMRQRLLNERYVDWLQQEIDQLQVAA